MGIHSTLFVCPSQPSLIAGIAVSKRRMDITDLLHVTVHSDIVNKNYTRYSRCPKAHTLYGYLRMSK